MRKPDAIKAFGMLMESDKQLHSFIIVQLIGNTWKLTAFGKNNEPLEFFLFDTVTRFLEEE